MSPELQRVVDANPQEAYFLGVLAHTVQTEMGAKIINHTPRLACIEVSVADDKHFIISVREVTPPPPF
jgi:hypothetical protein